VKEEMRDEDGWNAKQVPGERLDTQRRVATQTATSIF
jgi:hypothetical protein